MKHTSSLTTKKIVLTGLMAALTVIGSALRIKIPLEIAGTASFHLGNIMCALSGILLGPWLGGLASGLGSALYDIILDPSYIYECWITFLTKGLYGLVTGLVLLAWKKDWGYWKALVATLAGAVSYAVVYMAKTYFYSGLLVYDLTPDAALLNVVAKLPSTVFNAAVAVIFAPVLAIAIRKALKRSHLALDS
ncbi:MAG: ECF transporter S component [Firmicutes bacterium]|nr:ECF transporter S component [Bacillota bacterium]